MHKSRFHRLYLFVTGFFMGTADLVPGVSGGTIAFLAGIYQELLVSIKTVTGETLRLALQGKFAAAWRSVPFSFLLPLAIGLFTAIFSLAHLLSWLLAAYPTYVWALFFGLVLASVAVVMKRVKRWTANAGAGFVIAAVAAYFMVGAVPITTPATAAMTFASGAIAICAMILPGISGSFILLIMGQYERILAAAVERDFLTLGIFIAGCVVGLALFSRLLSWLLQRYYDTVVATLAGIMLGSSRKLWPWQDNGHAVIPEHFNATVALAALLSLLGALAVWHLDKREVVKEHAVDGTKQS